MGFNYQHFPAFRDLSPEQFEAFVRLGQFGKVPPGELLVRQGVPGTRIFFLISGTVRVHLDTEGGDCELNQIPAPTVIGEISFFSGEPSSAHVTTLSESMVLMMRFRTLREQLYAGNAAAAIVMLHLASQIAVRAATMTERVSELYGRQVELQSTAKNLFGEWSFL